MFLYKKSMYKERGEWHQNMNYVIIHILQKEKEERMAIYLVQGLLSIVTLIKRRDDFIRYTADITMLYFLSYLCAGSFDLSLSLYAVFLIAGIGKLQKISLGGIITGILICLYAGVGIMYQDAYMTLATVVTRYTYIIIYICMIFSEKIKRTKKVSADDYRYMVRSGLLTEMLIVIVVWMKDGIGARVVTNHQPIGGGIVLGISLVVGICYRQHLFRAGEMLLYDGISMILIILSGTRGYMIIFAMIMAVTMIVYFMDIPDHGNRMLQRIGVIFFVAAIVILWICIFDHGKTFELILRLDESLGYRENENLYVKELMKRIPWYREWFGWGFGRSAAGTKEALTAAGLASWNRRYMFGKLLQRTIFHNYWYTILFKQGISGLIVMILFYARMVKRICQDIKDRWIRYFLLMMAVGTVILLTFRITATCSMLEMLLVAYFIRQMEEDNGEGEKENAE